MSILFVTTYLPAGKNTALPQRACSMALMMAQVSSVWPSPFAPNDLTLTDWLIQGIAFSPDA
jgi:hypothetical protein